MKDDGLTAHALATLLHQRPRDEPVILREERRGPLLQQTYRIVGAKTEAGEWRLLIERKE